MSEHAKKEVVYRPSEKEVSDFAEAAGNGDRAAVKKFLSKYGDLILNESAEADFRCGVYMGGPALAYAAALGHEGIVDLLLDRGADVNSPNHAGWTPLELANLRGHKGVAQILKEHGGIPGNVGIREKIDRDVGAVDVYEDRIKVTFDGASVQINQFGNVFVSTDSPVLVKPSVIGVTAETGRTSVDISKDFNTVAMFGAKVEYAADGAMTVYTDGIVRVKPAAAKAPKVAGANLEVGDRMPDGTIYAGTVDGRKMFVMPHDAVLDASVINREEACGHKDWRLPDMGELDILFKNKDKGALKGTFNSSGAYKSYSTYSKNYEGDRGHYARYFGDEAQPEYVDARRLSSTAIRYVRFEP